MSGPVLNADWQAPPGILAGTVLRSGSDRDLPAEPRWLTQVHGSRVVKLGSRDFDDGAPEADAVIGKAPGSICAVRTADCLPVLLCSQDGEEIAAVHAGWRGLAAGIVEATIEHMDSRAETLLAWLGPAISQGAFEVGDEVREAFAPWADSEHFRKNERGRWQADLYGLARAKMAGMGVSEISGGGLCTYADRERFYSYRRDGASGRMLSFVYRP